MAQEKMYKAALEAIDQGQTARARDLFTRLLRSDSSKAEYWLWMSTLVETNQERIYCLESALRVDPGNEAAKRGLVIIGARQADKDVTPVPPVRRNWDKELVTVAEPSESPFRRIWENRLTRYGSLVAAMIFIVIIILATRGAGPKKAQPVLVYKVSPVATNTPAPTLSPTPTRTLVVRSPTPTFLGPTPLWMFLTVTYTPVPLYVNTPHPAIDAYRAGIRAFVRSDWVSALGFMQQGSTQEPDSPDIFYYIGESYRMQGKYQEAVLEYGQALEIDPKFAPAYLGRALAYEKINPHADIEGELNYAIEYDPNYVDAYLARARIRLIHNNPQGALDDLYIVDTLFSGSPMLYVLLAQAYLQLNDPAKAMEYAQIGFDMDKTSLLAYLTLARVYLANQDSATAKHYVDIYLLYVPEDASGWAVKAQAEYQLGNIDQALAACSQGTVADVENAPSWYYCGIIHLQEGDTRTAVNELIEAVNLDLLNFDYSLALAKALWADDRLTTAIRQFSSAETLAVTDAQLASVYYYRAQAYEAAESYSSALEDWQLLLALPPDQVPLEWRNYALERIAFILPPTATDTPTSTPTLTPSPPGSPMPTVINTITGIDTSTPFTTPTPSSTPHP